MQNHPNIFDRYGNPWTVDPEGLVAWPAGMTVDQAQESGLLVDSTDPEGPGASCNPSIYRELCRRAGVEIGAGPIGPG